MRLIRHTIYSIVTVCLTINGCGGDGPEPIEYGTDVCSYCKMTIVDHRFGTEYVTEKRKCYKFDSIECLAAYQIEHTDAAEQKNRLWVTDYNRPDQFLSVGLAVIVHAANGKSPMGVGLFAFDEAQAANDFLINNAGEAIDWNRALHLVRLQWSL